MSCSCSSLGVHQANTSDEACGARCSNCSCGGTPAPYYNQGGAVQEEHYVPTTVNRFVTALSVSCAFVMPACGKTAAIRFDGLGQMLVGSYLWNPLYGFLLVTRFDSLTGDVVVQNECLTGNAVPGTIIPKCTLFNITVPPCSCPQT